MPPSHRPEKHHPRPVRRHRNRHIRRQIRLHFRRQKSVGKKRRLPVLLHQHRLADERPPTPGTNVIKLFVDII